MAKGNQTSVDTGKRFVITGEDFTKRLIGCYVSLG
jgi:hypothetical protein